ncbi:E3 ubiquitin-protein ligase TRAF7-like isoform X2 [Liolophura sinensis]|uniref:E3 ubiquitin-protein ligase TRAF7-like isoform X2 n=1 Tax=Liolophura sinensis TaxID=3198878 RepID=UPI003158EF7D
MTVSCGHTFCRQCVTSVPTGRCPVDGVEIVNTAHIVNRIVLSQIEDLLTYCCYGLTLSNGTWVVDPSGCKEQITLGKKAEHEATCSYGTSPCPNNAEHCGKFRQRDLSQHLKVCPYTPCHNADKGCEFKGTRECVLDHLKVCGYRGLQRASAHLDDEVQQLLLINQELKNEVTELRDRLDKVELENRALKTEVSRNSSGQQMLQKKFEGLHGTLEVIQRALSKSPAISPSAVEKPRPVSREGRSPSVSSLSYPSQQQPEKWEMPFTFKCIGTYRGHKNTVFSTVACKRKLYSGGADGEVKVWNLDHLSLGCVKTLVGHKRTVHCLSVGHGYLYSAGEDFNIKMWTLDTAEEFKTLENAHENIICSMVICNGYLFTSSHSLIKVWEAKSLTHVHSMQGLYHWVRAMAVSTNKEVLFSGSHNTIDIWDATGKFTPEGKIEHTFGSIYSLTVTHEYLIAGTYNRNIQVFDLASRQHLHSLQGHIGIVTSLQASQSGQYLFSSSSDKSIKVWNLENMLPIQSLTRHEAAVNTLSLQEDLLISGSEDTEIKIYKYFQMQIGF